MRTREIEKFDGQDVIIYLDPEVGDDIWGYIDDVDSQDKELSLATKRGTIIIPFKCIDDIELDETMQDDNDTNDDTDIER